MGGMTRERGASRRHGRREEEGGDATALIGFTTGTEGGRSSTMKIELKTNK
jgi:hypothetical protein